MLPYLGNLRFHPTPGITLSPFGPLVLVGIVLGRKFVFARARELKLDPDEIQGAALISLLFGFVAAHATAVLFYHPERLQTEGWSVLLRIWDGWSSLGGIAGALIGLSLYRLRLRRSMLAHWDCLIQGFLLGWVFGRLGCTVMFDHPGIASDFLLAFEHPQGPRHNLGFYELLYTLFVLLPVSRGVHRRYKDRIGLQCAAAAILYAPARFALDFLRLPQEEGGDLRIVLGLTWAQICCLLLFGVGLYLIRRDAVRGLRAHRPR